MMTAEPPAIELDADAQRPVGVRRSLLASLIKLARPLQWAKGAFVIVGPAYGEALASVPNLVAVAGAFLSFGFASSACYVVNDLRDRDADRLHPRKRRRPIACGDVSAPQARAFAGVLTVLSFACLGLVAATAGTTPAGIVALIVAGYMLNTHAYSLGIKRHAILDVMSLSVGFVLRVLGGCAAVAIEPSSWLLNCTFFISMFLAFGKRLGERRTMGDDASSVRGVQGQYTDDLLRMAVVVTAVACLMTYAGYVQAQADRFTRGLNLLWLTMLPATYGLFRGILQLERGEYDDPTELAANDRPFQASVLIFAAITGIVFATGRHP